MELKIVNPNSFMMHTALGISEERSNELCDLMTAYTKEHPIMTSADSMHYIGKICNTIEELAWCSFTHGCYCTTVSAISFPNLNRKQ